MAGFVLDQAIDLPEDVIRGRDIRVVPGTIRLGDRDLSGVDPEALLKAVRESGLLPTVGIAPPARFLKVYQEMLSRHEVVFSIHTSSSLTTMINSARMAAEMLDVGDRVRVVDSGTATVAAGLVVMEAIEADEAGASPDEVEAVIRRASAQAGLLFYVRNLPALSRIRPVEGLKRLVRGEVSLSSAVKLLGFRGRGAVLTLANGRIQALSRPSSVQDAFQELLHELEKRAGKRFRAMAGYTGMKAEAEALAEEVARRCGAPVPAVQMSPLILAAIGPDAFGIGYRRLSDEA